MKNDSVVNLIIPGAPKSGTTSITAILNEHKSIFVPPVKEPRYFIKKEIQNLNVDDPLKKYLLNSSILNWKTYESIYKNDAQYKIDASVQYLYYYKTAIDLIKEKLGDPYIIIVLRDPVKRALSNFKFNIKSERCTTLREAIEEELEGKRNDLNSFYHYYKQSLYFEAVNAFMKNFSQVKVFFYEDFQNDNLKFVNEILSDLNLEAFIDLPKIPKLNTSSELNFVGKILVGRLSVFNIASKTILPLLYNRAELYQKKMRVSAKYSKKAISINKSTPSEILELQKLFEQDNKELKDLLQIKTLPWENNPKS